MTSRLRLLRRAAFAALMFIPLRMVVAQEAAVEPTLPEVGIVERLGNHLPLDAEYYDEKGTLVPLRSVIDRPTIITFVYYRCPGICSPLLNELSRMVEKMDLEPGKDYRILTLGFDHREGPELAAEKKENYLQALKR